MSVKNGYISSAVAVRRELLSRGHLRWIEKNLEFFAEGSSDLMVAYDEDEEFYYLPKGILLDPTLPKLPKLVDRRVTRKVDLPECVMTLRSYQKMPCKKLRKAGGGILEAATGAGKTSMMVYLISKFEQKTLIVVHTNDLVEQWTERLHSAMPGIKVGRIGGGRFDEAAPVVVATVQTLARLDFDKSDFTEQFGLVILDECVVSGTMIATPSGEVPIERLAIGDVIFGWDEFEQRIVETTVEHVFEPRMAQAGDLWYSQGVVATWNHPFLTKAGWRDAEEIKLGDKLLTAKTSKRNSGLSMVWTRVSSSRQATSSLFPCVCQENQKEKLFQTTKRSRFLEKSRRLFAFRAKPLQESNTGVGGECAEGLEGQDWLQTPNGGQWDTAARTPDQVGADDGGQDRVRSDSGRRRAAVPLQARLGFSRCETCCGVRWRKPSSKISSATGQKEGRAAGPFGMAVLAFLELGGRWELEEDGRGYTTHNIETGTGTFIANGVVVHNCHRAPASSFAKVLSSMSARYIYGCTATPTRQDGMHPLMHAIIGRTVARVKKRGLVERGSLVKPVVRMIETSFNSQAVPQMRRARNQYARAKLYQRVIQDLTSDIDRNEIIVKLIIRHRDESVLVLSDRKGHLQTIHDLVMMQDASVKCFVVTSDTPKDIRSQLLDDMRAGRANVLLATQLADEGLDLPVLNVLVLTFPTKAVQRLTQRIGRVMRSADGKSSALIYDLVDCKVPSFLKHATTRWLHYRRVEKMLVKGWSPRKNAMREYGEGFADGGELPWKKNKQPRRPKGH